MDYMYLSCGLGRGLVNCFFQQWENMLKIKERWLQVWIELSEVQSV